MTIAPIPTADIPAKWLTLVPLAEKIANRSQDRYTLNILKADLHTGISQAWTAQDGDTVKALCVTSIGSSYISIDACAGEAREDWQSELLLAIEKWAKLLGKKNIICLARTGWTSFFKQSGYREVHREFLKRI